MSESTKFTIRGLICFVFGFLMHQTDHPLSAMQHRGTPVRWLQGTRNVIGGMMVSAMILMYWEERPYTWTERLGVVYQVLMNTGTGVFTGYIVDEYFGEPRHPGGMNRWPRKSS